MEDFDSTRELSQSHLGRLQPLQVIPRDPHPTCPLDRKLTLSLSLSRFSYTCVYI